MFISNRYISNNIEFFYVTIAFYVTTECFHKFFQGGKSPPVLVRLGKVKLKVSTSVSRYLLCISVLLNVYDSV